MARSLTKTVLVGFMGAGKSTLARQLDPRAVDSDEVLEQRLGAAIADLFRERGEKAFRAQEEELVLELLADAAISTLALGGGAVGSARVRAALGDHEVLWLDVSLAEARRRVQGSARPLALDPERLAALHREREALYAEVATITALVADELPAALSWPRPSGSRLLWGVNRVIVGPGAARADVLPGRAYAVTDENVARVLAVEPPALVLAAGEEHKSLATAERVWRWLAEQGATRADHVRAVGGGVVGDLAGFCAATYQRGIDVVQVPTTLVAQVDSAYGGKTGVDLPEAKNYVGAYHQPAAVLVDCGLLESLPAAELAAGYAEVLKTALIAGGALWERVRGGGEVDAEVVLACARTKLRIVGEDERDGGARQALNLGHTVAHAIETVTGYSRYRHGEAVALGLLAALRLSGQEDLRAEAAELLAARGLPTRLEHAGAQEVVRATRRDKKRLGEGATPFVLVRAPGDIVVGQRVAARELESAVAELVA